MQIPIRYGYFILFILALAFASPQNAKAQASSYEELQAAYIYNFAKYIRWPEEQPTFVIGIVGDNEGILTVLTNVLKSKKIGGKPVEVGNVDKTDTLTQYHILYIPHTESKKVEGITQSLQGKSVLVVTERDMIKKGASISFTVIDNKLRFKLNREVLQNARLIASEGLIKLAIVE
ncbi:putative transmembrane protein [Fulvivirga imtechensis AK7]|uniref:Putative transmembrane protein n=1 Tax=Fulvivirga imtechensis AK7 TaxID=1237149 RepID=L8JVJ0_9BACT|nr:YfiR family protein [Fulvivirga imtechensis]ELR73071.1 putative transmembrane protein [Fulvivirga imtechensis AK7]